MQYPSLELRIETWTREAVARWGLDWPRIAEHIERRMRALSAADRDAVDAESALTLAHVGDEAKH